jgi:hypothetical protein
MALSLPSQASTRSGPHGLRTQFTSFFNADRAPVPSSAAPSLDDHPAWRKKGNRFGISFFGSRENPGTPSEGATTTTPAESEATYAENGVGTNNSVSRSIDTLSSSGQSGRTQYTQAWVRRPRRKRGSSTKVTASCRAALRDKMVRKHLITCVISGVLLLAVTAICTLFPWHLMVNSLTLTNRLCRSWICRRLQFVGTAGIPHLVNSSDHDLHYVLLPLTCSNLFAGHPHRETWLCVSPSA